MAFTPDDRFLATAPLRNREARIWDLSSGKLALTFPQKADASSVAFERSGKFLAVGMVDGSVSIWDVSEHKSIVESQARTSKSVENLRFTRNGERLIIGLENGLTELIPWTPQESLDVACARLRSDAITRDFQAYEGAGFTQSACK